MSIAWPYMRDLAADSERQGFELTLIAELNLNDIKGHRAPSLDCWTLAPAVAAVTERLELMLAVRPNYHSPSLTAKALSTLDTIAPGRISLNVVSSWWKDEAAQYGAPFDVHDARYARTQEWLDVVSRLLREDTVTHPGPLYQLDAAVLEPKPSRRPARLHGRRVAEGQGGHRRPGRCVCHARRCAGRYRGQGSGPDARREQAGRPPLEFGVSGYVICRDTEAAARAELDRILDVRASPEAYASYQDFVEGSQLESRVSLEEYSVSNRGLRSGLIGTPEQIIERLRAYEQAGVGLMLLQFSPQHEEMARFGAEVISRYPGLGGRLAPLSGAGPEAGARVPGRVTSAFLAVLQLFREQPVELTRTARLRGPARRQWPGEPLLDQAVQQPPGRARGHLEQPPGRVRVHDQCGGRLGQLPGQPRQRVQGPDPAGCPRARLARCRDQRVSLPARS